MKAMVFAAGLGTRLRPYTNDRPKALVEVGGIPLLDLQLRRLMRLGCSKVVVNVHHHAEMVIGHLAQLETGGMEVCISDESDLLRDTGGGLLHALPLLDGAEPVYLCNVDVLTDLDPHILISAHLASHALATLGVLHRPSSRQLTFNAEMELTGWRNHGKGETKGNPSATDGEWAFCGLHVIQPELLHHTQRQGVFSVIDLYLDAAASGRIKGMDLAGARWLDVGKPAELERGQELLPWVQ